MTILHPLKFVDSTHKQLVLVAFLVLFFLASITRIYKLGSLPQAFFGDEAALGYNGWSILLTGRDEWGQFLPFTLRSFDDDKPAIYSYLTIPFIAVDGLNQTTSRAPAAVAGIILPLAIFGLMLKLQKRVEVAFLAGLGVIISPWHLEISRTAIEAGVALSMFTAGLYLFNVKTKWSEVLAWLLIVLTLFTYHTARLLVPPILLLAWWWGGVPRHSSFGVGNIKKWLLPAIAVVILAAGLVLSFTGSSDRFKQISVFSSIRIQLLREEAIREDGTSGMVPVWLTRAFHNKPLDWFNNIAWSYIQNTSLEYLFMGGAQPPRVRIPETGQFIVVLLPVFIWGLVVKVRRAEPQDWWWLSWLVLAPVPASLTIAEIPHTYRTLFMLVPLVVIMAEGAADLAQILAVRSKLLAGVGIFAGVMLTLFFFGRAWHQYAVHQQLNQPWYRQYGYQSMVKFLNEVADTPRDRIVISQVEMEPYIFVLFYNQIDPRVYQAWPQKRLAHQAIEAGETEWQMFQYSFNQKHCPYDELTPDLDPDNLYFVGRSCNLPQGYIRRGQISFQDGSPMFYVDQPDPTEVTKLLNTVEIGQILEKY